MVEHFADYDPADLGTPNLGIDQIESYGLIDLHFNYKTGELLPVPLNIGLHILNASDTEYFADYRDGDGGFYGSGITYNLSLGVEF